jgi:hypothetical protein
MKSIKKTFHIPPSYTFTAGCSNPATVISLAPFVSSCSSPLNYVGGLRPYYQQRKFLSTSNTSTLSSSSSLSTVAIHSTDDDNYQTPPSSSGSSDDSSKMNPFEILSKEHISQSLNQVRYEISSNVYLC